MTSTPRPEYYRADDEGAQLLITTAYVPLGIGAAVYFHTDPNGSIVPLAEVPALIEKLQEIAEAARTEAAR